MTTMKDRQIQTPRRRNNQGFTLIEIMMVVVIIGILLSVMINKFRGRTDQAREVAASAHIQSIGNALDLYEMDNGFYPTTQQGLEALMSKPASAPTPQNWRQPYLDRLPVDPWGSNYNYQQPGTHNQFGYDLWSSGKDAQSGTADDITSWEN
ncbi:MAG: type II secretion system major pseudopilin GspG [Verrucomicrobiota bacterium]|nr:type II secretion system major pseudopilin GspG [Verrucomicrobiota bacterium]MDI9383062.1 type II secretion system major pseudopilin GspG [Verrucomicrobiota bacterium]